MRIEEENASRIVCTIRKFKFVMKFYAENEFRDGKWNGITIDLISYRMAQLHTHEFPCNKLQFDYYNMNVKHVDTHMKFVIQTESFPFHH